MTRKLSNITSFIVFAAVAVVLILADRFTKNLAVEALGGGVSIPFVPGVLDFYLVYNNGAAFGMFEGGTYVFLAIAAVASVVMIAYIAFVKRHAVLEAIALGGICAGALGNAIDRLVNDGEVVDFIHTLFIDFPLFNIADSAITIGVILLIITILFSNKGTSSIEAEE